MKHLLLFLVLALLLFLPRAEAQLTVSAPETLSERRVGRTVFEYVMRANVINSATVAAKGVVATCTSTSSRTTVVEGTLTIGNVAAQGSAASTDTITIAHDRTVPFDPAVLRWTFTKVPDAPTVSAPASPSAAASTNLVGSAEPGSTVEVVGGASTVTGTASGTGTFSVSVPLQAARLNRLFVTALNAAGRSEPVPVEVIQDTVAPSLFIDFPPDGATLTNDAIVVAGRVGDMLSGFLGLGVNVNGQPGNVVVGLGNNGTFERANVPLALGANTLTATATDVNGNAVTRSITVTRVSLTGPRMTAIAGDMQSARVHERLPAPILVRITNADGSPFPGKVVTFDVIRSDGRLSPGIQPTDPSTLMFQTLTDADGYAWAYWTLGGDAGCGNNRVNVTSRDIAGTIFFCASARPSPPRQLNIGSGNNQRAEAGGPAPEALRAWVSDSCNGIKDVPVTFTVTSGGGKVNGQDSVTVNTTATGHAAVQFTLGPDGGQNLVEANFPGHPGLPATFVATGVVRDATKPTTFTGLVLDNTSQPIGGATCSLTIAGTTFTTTSDLQGRFVFGPATLPSAIPNLPSGVADLTVNGLSATSLGGVFIPPNSFPGLSYTATLIPNAENSLATPVLLPRLNPNNARTYDGTTDLVLTCEGMAGLKMTIKAGSMRKFDGSLVTPQNPAVVSLNQVHHDQIPMPIPDGASPPFAWTLQPARATFDPPIRVEYPNMSGLPAGSIAYFLTYNHDTEKFEIFASGHVTPDASTILTDPGAGLSVSGWGCNCPPYSVTGNCRKCDAPTANQAMDSVGTFTNKNPIVPDDTRRFGVVCGYTQTPHTVVAVCGCDAKTGKSVAHARCNFEVVYKAYNKDITKPEDIAVVTAHENQHVANWKKAFDRIYPHALEIDGKQYSNREECDAEVAQFNDFAAFVLGLAESDNTALDFLDQITLACDRILFFPASPAADTTTASFPDYSFPDVTNSFTFSGNGQSISAHELASFELKNVSAPDLFGANGPGTLPDFVSDDYVRIVGVDTSSGSNRYAVSDFFKIRQGETVTIQNFAFTDIPPRKPHMLAVALGQPILTTLGQTTQARVTATFADKTTADVTPATSGTSYRTSNVGVAKVDNSGLVLATGIGIAYVTAVNEGSAAVAQVTVATPGDPLTTVRGFARLANGAPAGGTSVTLAEFAFTTTSGADGSFTFANVPTTSGVLTLNAVLGNLRSLARSVVPFKGSTTDAGILVLENLFSTVSPGTQDFPGVSLGAGISLATNPSLTGTVVADVTSALGQPLPGGLTMCYLGKTRSIPQYLSSRYAAAGALTGPCAPPEAVETQTGRIRSVVVRRNDNGALDFYYQVLNDNTLAQNRYDFFRMLIPGTAPFTISYRTDGLAGIAGGSAFTIGTRAPSTGDNSNFQGRGIAFSSFLGNSTNLHAGEASRFVVVRTSATTFAQQQAIISTADSLVAQVFVPALIPGALVSTLFDTDGDGYTDAQETVAGTDPRDARSALRIGAILARGADVVLEFATVPGRLYAIECCTDLARGEWFVVQDQIAGTGQPIQIQDLAAATRQPRCFYRLRVTNP